MNVRRPTLQGLETEFGFSALDRHGKRCDGQALTAVMEAVPKQVPTVTNGRNGYFLANGGLLYVDTGNHLEWSTPECTSPKEVVRYQRAGEILIARVAAEVEASAAFSKVHVFKANVSYPSPNVTFGCHESSLYRNFGGSMARYLVPFLVSRVVYTGAGGLFSGSSAARFSLSPRVAFLERESSCHTTNRRGIFNTKNESLSGAGYQRLHLICGDSTCSQFQTWLKLGTTMLVVAMVDAGLSPGEGLQLGRSVSTMRRFASDPTCQTVVHDLNHPDGITALGIQHHYLALAEQYADSAFMPAWAEEVCTAWRATLASLAADPMSLFDRLDWPLKHRLMQQRIEKHALGSQANVELWNNAVTAVETSALASQRLNTFPLKYDTVKSWRLKRNDLGATIRAEAKKLAKGGFHWRQLDQFMGLRWELCELDMAFGDLSADGLFNTLDAAGALNHRLWSEAECEAAITEPPQTGRAKIRGSEIQRLSRKRNRIRHGGWSRISAGTSWLDLSDPFATVARWTRQPPDSAAELTDLDVPAFLRRRQAERARGQD